MELEKAWQRAWQMELEKVWQRAWQRELGKELSMSKAWPTEMLEETRLGFFEEARLGFLWLGSYRTILRTWSLQLDNMPLF